MKKVLIDTDVILSILQGKPMLEPVTVSRAEIIVAG